MSDDERERAAAKAAHAEAQRADRQADELILQSRAVVSKLRAVREDRFTDKLRDIIRGVA